MKSWAILHTGGCNGKRGINITLVSYRELIASRISSCGDECELIVVDVKVVRRTGFKREVHEAHQKTQTRALGFMRSEEFHAAELEVVKSRMLGSI